MKKKWLPIIIIIVLILSSWWILTNTSEINKKIDQSAENAEADKPETIQAKNIHIVETEQGKKIWELTAKRAVYHNKDARLHNITGQFYGDQDTILLNFKAPEGNYIQEEHKLSLDKGAEVKHPDEKISISSDTMYWTNKSDKIFAEGQVKIVKEGFGISYGEKTTFTSDFKNIKIEGNTYSELSF
jgi:LPS export ABC transporter protein LptC